MNPWAVDIEPSAIGKRRAFFDCLAVTIGIDSGDRPLITDAVQTIRRLMEDTGAAQVVVEGLPPNGQALARADNRMPPVFDILVELADTLDLLDELVERLEEYGENVHLMPFGWNCDLHFDPAGRQGAQMIVGSVADMPVPSSSAGCESRRGLLRRR
ncbi:hypothetical protein IRT45_30840 [Nocardia sp. BSTN01]|uniref:hypothetical protein n=1 Tax=Nocardia sp. BSTN01 TaxID=2783665 RepID=UPI00189098DB|nr:hypothetical protein [Nocardia sp. BSTN01]MBF5001531.1 hypothetical protein [Nocardia sp. BSTN01]